MKKSDANILVRRLDTQKRELKKPSRLREVGMGLAIAASVATAGKTFHNTTSISKAEKTSPEYVESNRIEDIKYDIGSAHDNLIDKSDVNVSFMPLPDGGVTFNTTNSYSPANLQKSKEYLARAIGNMEAQKRDDGLVKTLKEVHATLPDFSPLPDKSPKPNYTAQYTQLSTAYKQLDAQKKVYDEQIETKYGAPLKKNFFGSMLSSMAATLSTMGFFHLRGKRRELEKSLSAFIAIAAFVFMLILLSPHFTGFAVYEASSTDFTYFTSTVFFLIGVLFAGLYFKFRTY